MVYIQYRELMGTQYLISPLRNSPLFSHRNRPSTGNKSKDLLHGVLICINVSGFRFQAVDSIITRIMETSGSACSTGRAQWL